MRDACRLSAPSLRGFTLLELLVVLLIVSVAAGLAAPRLLAALPGAQVRAAGAKVAALLRLAGSRAVTEQRRFRVTVDGPLATLTLGEEGDSWGEVESPTPTEAGGVLRLPEGVGLRLQGEGFAGNPGDRGEVFFFPQGGCSPVRIWIGDGRRLLAVETDFITGRVKVGDLVRTGGAR